MYHEFEDSEDHLPNNKRKSRSTENLLASADGDDVSNAIGSSASNHGAHSDVKSKRTPSEKKRHSSESDVTYLKESICGDDPESTDTFRAKSDIHWDSSHIQEKKKNKATNLENLFNGKGSTHTTEEKGKLLTSDIDINIFDKPNFVIPDIKVSDFSEGGQSDVAIETITMDTNTTDENSKMSAQPKSDNSKAKTNGDFESNDVSRDAKQIMKEIPVIHANHSTTEENSISTIASPGSTSFFREHSKIIESDPKNMREGVLETETRSMHTFTSSTAKEVKKSEDKKGFHFKNPFKKSKGKAPPPPPPLPPPEFLFIDENLTQLPNSDIHLQGSGENTVTHLTPMAPERGKNSLQKFTASLDRKNSLDGKWRACVDEYSSTFLKEKKLKHKPERKVNKITDFGKYDSIRQVFGKMPLPMKTTPAFFPGHNVDETLTYGSMDRRDKTASGQFASKTAKANTNNLTGDDLNTFVYHVNKTSASQPDLRNMGRGQRIVGHKMAMTNRGLDVIQVDKMRQQTSDPFRRSYHKEQDIDFNIEKDSVEDKAAFIVGDAVSRAVHNVNSGKIVNEAVQKAVHKVKEDAEVAEVKFSPVLAGFDVVDIQTLLNKSEREVRHAHHKSFLQRDKIVKTTEQRIQKEGNEQKRLAPPEDDDDTHEVLSQLDENIAAAEAALLRDARLREEESRREFEAAMEKRRREERQREDAKALLAMEAKIKQQQVEAKKRQTSHMSTTMMSTQQVSMSNSYQQQSSKGKRLRAQSMDELVDIQRPRSQSVDSWTETRSEKIYAVDEQTQTEVKPRYVRRVHTTQTQTDPRVATWVKRAAAQKKSWSTQTDAQQQTAADIRRLNWAPHYAANSDGHTSTIRKWYEVEDLDAMRPKHHAHFQVRSQSLHDLTNLDSPSPPSHRRSVHMDSPSPPPRRRSVGLDTPSPPPRRRSHKPNIRVITQSRESLDVASEPPLSPTSSASFQYVHYGGGKSSSQHHHHHHHHQAQSHSRDSTWGDGRKFHVEHGFTSVPLGAKYNFDIADDTSQSNTTTRGNSHMNLTSAAYRTNASNTHRMERLHKLSQHDLQDHNLSSATYHHATNTRFAGHDVASHAQYNQSPLYSSQSSLYSSLDRKSMDDVHSGHVTKLHRAQHGGQLVPMATGKMVGGVGDGKNVRHDYYVTKEGENVMKVTEVTEKVTKTVEFVKDDVHRIVDKVGRESYGHSNVVRGEHVGYGDAGHRVTARPIWKEYDEQERSLHLSDEDADLPEMQYTYNSNTGRLYPLNRHYDDHIKQYVNDDVMITEL